MLSHFKTGLYKFVLLSMLLSLAGFTVALAASGDLDPTFDGDGLVTTDFGGGRADAVFAIAMQTHGKIVAAGYHRQEASNGPTDFALTRYNSDGSLDTGFGKRLLDFSGFDIAKDVALQANGKIVLAGETCNSPSAIGVCDLALARYNANGTLDTTFSGDGKLTIDFGGGPNAASSLAIQSNAKIVVVGDMDNGVDDDFAVYRLLADGSPDPTFSGDGKVSIGFGAGTRDGASDVVIQSDRKILVAGTTTKSPNGNFALVRLNPNGTLDTTFSADGRQVADFGGFDSVNAVAIQPDGRIVLVGFTDSTGRDSFAIARFNANGSPDNTFGKLLPTGKRNGKRAFSIVAGASSSAADVLVQQDGRIVLAGRTVDGLNTGVDFAVVRLNPNSGFDTTFGQRGKVIVDFGGYDFGSALARQPSDGRYVLGGWGGVTPSSSDFALARVLP